MYDWICPNCKTPNMYHDKWCIKSNCYNADGTRSRNPNNREH